MDEMITNPFVPMTSPSHSHFHALSSYFILATSFSALFFNSPWPNYDLPCTMIIADLFSYTPFPHDYTLPVLNAHFSLGFLLLPLFFFPSGTYSQHDLRNQLVFVMPFPFLRTYY
jgi:hypothetical protein